MDVTGKARDLFRDAERRAAADFGIEISGRRPHHVSVVHAHRARCPVISRWPWRSHEAKHWAVRQATVRRVAVQH